MKERLTGLFWVGSLGVDGLVYSEAFYKGTRVREILDTVGQVNGDFEKAASILNYDLDSDGFGAISREEISKVVKFASNNQIQTAREP